jgi:hypothetical protein
MFCHDKLEKNIYYRCPYMKKVPQDPYTGVVVSRCFKVFANQHGPNLVYPSTNLIMSIYCANLLLWHLKILPVDNSSDKALSQDQQITKSTVLSRKKSPLDGMNPSEAD